VPLPASARVTVKSATELEVLLDTRDAVVDPSTGSSLYGVAVWNPPGPQKSNADRTLKIATSCP
jgi:outer membrane protein assembly factor BamA